MTGPLGPVGSGNACCTYGFRTERDEAVEPLVSIVAQANREVLEWVAEMCQQ